MEKKMPHWAVAPYWVVLSLDKVTLWPDLRLYHSEGSQTGLCCHIG